MRKSKRVVSLLLVLVMTVLSVFAMTSCEEEKPELRYVVKNPAKCNIVRIVYNTKFADSEYAPEMITDYDANEVLECLNRYEEHRSELTYAGSKSEDVQVEIVVKEKDDLKIVLLGTNNCSHEGKDELVYDIANGEALKAEILTLIGK